MEQVHVIRHKVLIEGQSQRRVAREMGLSRNTVKKYLEVSEPKRLELNPRSRPVLEEVKPRMDQLLEEWAGRVTAKQRLTGSRLHRELVQEGYQVGVTLVRDYLREVKRRKAEVFIPLVHRPGDEAQVDFFEVTVDEAGTRRKAWQFLMRLMYSGRDGTGRDGTSPGFMTAATSSPSWTAMSRPWSTSARCPIGRSTTISHRR